MSIAEYTGKVVLEEKTQPHSDEQSARSTASKAVNLVPLLTGPAVVDKGGEPAGSK
ncbi:MAG: hypothetical protein JO356_21670 [Acidobacteria bacterium]|nr:hypothetical protein [Acidobacteriota bacterium]